MEMFKGIMMTFVFWMKLCDIIVFFATAIHHSTMLVDLEGECKYTQRCGPGQFCTDEGLCVIERRVGYGERCGGADVCEKHLECSSLISGVCVKVVWQSKLPESQCGEYFDDYGDLIAVRECVPPLTCKRGPPDEYGDILGGCVPPNRTLLPFEPDVCNEEYRKLGDTCTHPYECGPGLKCGRDKKCIKWVVTTSHDGVECGENSYGGELSVHCRPPMGCVDGVCELPGARQRPPGFVVEEEEGETPPEKKRKGRMERVIDMLF